MTIEEYLEALPKETIYFKPNPGNGGDALIAFGAHLLFKKNNISYKIVDENEDLSGKIVMYGGGGNFIEGKYHDCADFIQRYHQQAKKFILLPHTIFGYSSVLQNLGKNVDIICREKESYDHVSKFLNIGNVYLMDDLAFSINVKESFPDLKGSRVLALLMPLKRVVKELLYRTSSLKQMMPNNSKEFNCFRIDEEQTDIEIPQDNIDLPGKLILDWQMKDEKRVELMTSIIFKYLSSFERIRTNRLHMCIAGALLGKEVHFYNNSYWKNHSIYLHSIKDRFPTVKWMGENAVFDKLIIPK